MSFDDDISHLAELCTSSRGNPVVVTGGHHRSFAVVRRLGGAELSAIGGRCGATLPPEYEALLRKVGVGSLFRADDGVARIEIHDPKKIDALYGSSFDDPGVLWKQVLPVCALNRLQEIGVYLRHGDQWVFCVVPHDEHPDDWAESVGRTPSLPELIAELLATGGEMDVH